MTNTYRVERHSCHLRVPTTSLQTPTQPCQAVKGTPCRGLALNQFRPLDAGCKAKPSKKRGPFSAPDSKVQLTIKLSKLSGFCGTTSVFGNLCITRRIYIVHSDWEILNLEAPILGLDSVRVLRNILSDTQYTLSRTVQLEISPSIGHCDSIIRNLTLIHAAFVPNITSISPRLHCCVYDLV